MRLAIAVVMDGVEDEGGQHGQAVAIATGMAGRGHRVCYLSRWPVSRKKTRVSALLDAGIDVLTPRWVDHPRIRLRPTADDRARGRRLLASAWRERSLPRRELLLSPRVREEAANDFGRIGGRLLRTWCARNARDLPLVIHVVSRRSMPSLTDLRALGAPIVFSEFGRLALYGLAPGAAPRLDADVYTTDSPDSARELEAIEGAPVAIIPCIAGFDEPIHRARPIATRFAMINRLVDYKRTDVAVHAIALGEGELDIFGNGPDEPKLRALAAALAVDTRVRLHGHTDASGVRDALDAADAFISCSQLDGTPMSVLEAMSRGRAVVAYPIPGIESVLDDGVESIYFDGSPDGLASSLARLGHDSDLAARLGERARARWERLYAPSVLLDRYEDIYRHALSDRRRR